MAEQKDRVVLAYSGGLDTSVCIKWLQDEKNLDVIALVGDVGQEHDGLEQVRQKAHSEIARECIVADMREEFAEHYLTCAIAANALYENKYPLLSALLAPRSSPSTWWTSRTSTARSTWHTAARARATTRCASRRPSRRLDPELVIIAPVREWDLKSRPQEMAWAREHGVEVPTTHARPYSIDDNLWAAPSNAACWKTPGTSRPTTSTP